MKTTPAKFAALRAYHQTAEGRAARDAALLLWLEAAHKTLKPDTQPARLDRHRNTLRKERGAKY